MDAFYHLREEDLKTFSPYAVEAGETIVLNFTLIIRRNEREINYAVRGVFEAVAKIKINPTGWHRGAEI